MTRLTALLNRKRPRRVGLLATLACALLAVGLIAGGGAASASVSAPQLKAASSSDPTWPAPSEQLEVSGGSNPLCTFTDWGGTFYCNSEALVLMPNNYFEVFVIGTNHTVYTQWSSSSGLSGWNDSLGGQCLDPHQNGANYTGEDVGLWWTNPSNGWNWTIDCIGTDGGRWFDQRTGSAAGAWSGWYA